jgi:hypothetical protein
MTQEYFNPTKRIMAETLRRRMTGGVLAEDSSPLPKRTTTAIGVRKSLPLADSLPTRPNATGGELDGILAKLARMTPAEREQLKALLNK